MCTVQSIKDAIRENCQSQYDMESTDIDRVLQTLPFSGHESLFDQPPLPKRPYWPRKNTKIKNSSSTPQSFSRKIPASSMPSRSERSEVNGGLSD